tara:strand:+ start:233 stop:367 length:135 start_codon:yes stop_codon:yes gene_type:complete
MSINPETTSSLHITTGSEGAAVKASASIALLGRPLKLTVLNLVR